MFGYLLMNGYWKGMVIERVTWNIIGKIAPPEKFFWSRNWFSPLSPTMNPPSPFFFSLSLQLCSPPVLFRTLLSSRRLHTKELRVPISSIVEVDSDLWPQRVITLLQLQLLSTQFSLDLILVSFISQWQSVSHIILAVVVTVKLVIYCLQIWALIQCDFYMRVLLLTNRLKKTHLFERGHFLDYRV